MAKTSPNDTEKTLAERIAEAADRAGIPRERMWEILSDGGWLRDAIVAEDRRQIATRYRAAAKERIQARRALARGAPPGPPEKGARVDAKPGSKNVDPSQRKEKTPLTREADHRGSSAGVSEVHRTSRPEVERHFAYPRPNGLFFLPDAPGPVLAMLPRGGRA